MPAVFSKKFARRGRPRSGRDENSPALLVLGIASRFCNESLERTTDMEASRQTPVCLALIAIPFQPSTSRTVAITRLNPAINRWAIFSRPLRGRHACLFFRESVRSSAPAPRFWSTRWRAAVGIDNGSPFGNAGRSFQRLHAVNAL
jgi:hypothetical protein